MQKQTFSIQVGSEQQSGTPSTHICSPKVTYTHQKGNQFYSLETLAQTAQTAQMTQAFAGYKYAAPMPFSLSPFNA